MATKYVKKYTIYEVSSDGLLKHCEISAGYGYYRTVDDVFDTEEDAMAFISNHDLGACVIVPCVYATWVDDDESA